MAKLYQGHDNNITIFETLERVTESLKKFQWIFEGDWALGIPRLCNFPKKKEYVKKEWEMFQDDKIHIKILEDLDVDILIWIGINESYFKSLPSNFKKE